METNTKIEYKQITTEQIRKEFKNECKEMSIETLYTTANGLYNTYLTIKKIYNGRYGSTKRLHDIIEYCNIAIEVYYDRTKKGAK